MSLCQNSEPRLKNNNIAYLGNMKLFDNSLPTHHRLANIRDNHSALDLAEHYFRRGIEVFKQAGNEGFFNTLNHSLLALIYAKKGECDQALNIAEKALSDALTQGGTIAPICEIILSSILLESGDHTQARRRLANSVKLLKKMEVETSEKDSYLFRIQMFGPIRVFHGEHEINVAMWRTVKSRHLLAYLAHQNKPISTDQIMEDLWPYVDPDRALALFHTTLYYLRRLLQQFTNKEVIIRGSRRYQLRPGSILIDRFQFEETAHLALEKETTAALAEQLEAAVSLYRGDYLEDLDYQWIAPIQEELKNLNMELRQKLAVYYLQNKIPSKALLHLHHLMALNPYSEKILKLLLIAYAEKGDQAAVKKYYAAFARNISEELGLQPSSEMEKFFANLSK